MVEVPVYTTDGKQTGQMAIEEDHLGTRVRPPLLKQAIVMYQANRRQGTASGKTRGQVTGSTRKLYRQKGTGRARMGSARTPQRRGGGQAFAKSARDFRQQMPKRMRRLACLNAVLAKILSGDVLILDELSFDQPKTQKLRSILSALGAQRGCVVALEAPDKVIYQSSTNLSKTDIRPVRELNAYDVLRRNKLIFTKPAFEALVAWAAREYNE